LVVQANYAKALYCDMMITEIDIYEQIKDKLGEKESRNLIAFVEERRKQDLEHLATKADLEQLRLATKADLAEVRTDVEKVRVDVEKLRADMHLEFSKVRQENDNRHQEQIRWMVGGWISLILAILATILVR
jgi:hypothetical protein